MTQGQSQVTLLKVAKFAQICRTTPRTIRFYEKRGLLKPALIDQFSGYRFYDSKQAREVFKVKLFQNFDMSLSDISKSIRKYKEYTFLEKKLHEIKKEIDDKNKEYSFLKKVNDFLFSKEKLEAFLKTKNVGHYTLFTILKKNGRYDQLDDYVKDLQKQAEKLRIKATDKYILIYLEPERYGPNGIAMEVGLICAQKSADKLPPNYYFREIPKQKAVVYDYKGPHAYLTFVHKRIFYDDYFKKHLIEKYPYDFFVYNPFNTKSPYDFLTKVVYPID